MKLESQYFIDDGASHRIYSIIFELKNRKTCPKNLCMVWSNFDAKED